MTAILPVKSKRFSIVPPEIFFRPTRNFACRSPFGFLSCSPAYRRTACLTFPKSSTVIRNGVSKSRLKTCRSLLYENQPRYRTPSVGVYSGKAPYEWRVFLHGGMLMAFADYALFVIAHNELEDMNAVTVSCQTEFLKGAAPTTPSSLMAK